MMQEFVQAIQNSIRDTMKGMHTAIPGEIASFDAASGTATVKPSMKYRKPNGETIDFPQLTGLPVCFPQGSGQGATIAYPVKPGDGCILIIAEQSLDYWKYGQETDTDLSFDLSNAMCIPGLFSKGNSAMEEACAENAVVVKAGGSKIVVKQGEISITAAQVTINGNLKVTGSATTAGDTTAQGISVATHTHTGDSGGRTSTPG